MLNPYRDQDGVLHYYFRPDVMRLSLANGNNDPSRLPTARTAPSLFMLARIPAPTGGVDSTADSPDFTAAMYSLSTDSSILGFML